MPNHHPTEPVEDISAATPPPNTKKASTKKADPRRQLGNAGETLAVRTLTENGLTIVTRNWRCATGELDIVAHDIAPDYATGEMAATWLVLVEVRTRRGDRYGTAIQSVSTRKQARK